MDWDNKEDVLKAIKYYGSSLHHASKRLQDDYDVVLASVQQNAPSLIYASDRLQDNIELLIILKESTLTKQWKIYDYTSFVPFFNHKMEQLESLLLEEELLNSIPENNISKKIVKF